MKKNKINCDVSNCSYNNTKDCECSLDNVSISCQCAGESCTNTSSTICQSFSSSGGIITDNEYEVTSEMEKE